MRQLLDLSKYDDRYPGSWSCKHTPGYHNPRTREKGKVPGVNPGTYFYATSEVITDIPTGATEYNPETDEHDIPVMSTIASIHYFDENYKDIPKHLNEHLETKRHSMASLELFSDSCRLLDELKEMRERAVFNGHTKSCPQGKECECGRDEMVAELQRLLK